MPVSAPWQGSISFSDGTRPAFIISMSYENHKPITMKLLETWFCYRGQLKPFDFVLKGIVPGILLGLVAMRLEATLNASGLIILPFLAFSVWPASAMILKVASSNWRAEKKA